MAWKNRVMHEFGLDKRAVAASRQYFCDAGIDQRTLDLGQQGLIVCEDLWLEMLNLKPQQERSSTTTSPGSGPSLQVNHFARENPFFSPDEDKGANGSLIDEDIKLWDPEYEVLTSRNRTSWCLKMSKQPKVLVQNWIKCLGGFFLIKPCEETQDPAVQALREMKEVGKTKWFRKTIQEPVREHDLASMVLRIAEPTMILAKRSKFLEDSFRKYQWREALLLALANLTEGFEMRPAGDITVDRQLQMLVSAFDLVPASITPHTLFFLTSKQNFVSACFDWLMWPISGIKQVDEQFRPQDIKGVYGEICRLEAVSWVDWGLSEQMQEILSLSKQLRDNRKAWKAWAHGDRNRNRDPSEHKCRLCTHLGDSDKCKQYIAVQDGNLKFALENKLIVADGDDMLKPLKMPEGETEKICIPVDTLPLEHIKFNQEAYDRCGQFTVVLVDSITGEEVAGGVFNFLDAEEMGEMGENQAKLKALTKKLKRQKAFEDWDYGEMHGLGSRQPTGGCPADSYGPYSGSEVLQQEDVQALFGYSTGTVSGHRAYSVKARAACAVGGEGAEGAWSIRERAGQSWSCCIQLLELHSTSAHGQGWDVDGVVPAAEKRVQA
ncbi:hypothetical protein BJ138DRAFT_1119749 [Hygrophoropsis aurantiaca]|uniref:Uncharacterized protein n=1 Tax=Hygrophoropsis aurantiaca TaxID=72124 RepID=A0ACB7ZT98_9AGAM|nr:hypothetical protein BJ138DRAFT_1119749 [Hygrophoropsis aurantiaca]